MQCRSKKMFQVQEHTVNGFFLICADSDGAPESTFNLRLHVPQESALDTGLALGRKKRSLAIVLLQTRY